MAIIDRRERERAYAGNTFVNYLAEAIDGSARFRQEYAARLDVVKSSQMPFERSPDGLIKHIINERMDTKECCIDAYMQFLPPGKASGKQRHLSEEIVYVVEGRGYDLHWDVKFDCREEFVWEWEETPRRFEWSQGDFVYIPPYCAHQHVNADPNNEARIIVVNSRIVRAMGFDWFEQLENAEAY
jgi:gentisate 1,2-dioxygenase